MSDSYKDYLDSDEWKKLRTRVRRRARGWCERCKVGPRADIHHLTYERLGNERLDDLVAVCRECHEYLHGRRAQDPAAVAYTERETKDVRFLYEFQRYGVVETLVSRNGALAAAWHKRQRSLQSDPIASH